MKKMKNTKKMKKMLGCLFLAASLAFTFVGCGSSQEQAPAPADGQNQAAGSEESAAKEAVTESAKAAENSGEKITIGWAMAYFDHPVYQLLMQGAQEVADGLETVNWFLPTERTMPRPRPPRLIPFLPRVWTRLS